MPATPWKGTRRTEDPFNVAPSGARDFGAELWRLRPGLDRSEPRGADRPPASNCWFGPDSANYIGPVGQLDLIASDVRTDFQSLYGFMRVLLPPVATVALGRSALSRLDTRPTPI